MSHLPIEETNLFRKVDNLTDRIWKEIDKWKPFLLDTVGKQLVRAPDSIGANLVEGDGRFHAADALRFFFIARASGRGTLYWLRRCHRRGLISEELSIELVSDCNYIFTSLNGLINYRKSQMSQVREETTVDDPPTSTLNTQHLLISDNPNQPTPTVVS